MKIGELAAQAGCDVQTVRFYEREGLLAEPARTDAGYRSYDASHLSRLNFIRHCRSLDMPLAEVRKLLAFAQEPDKSCAEVDSLLDAHIAAVQERIAALQRLERQLAMLRQSCKGDGAQPCGILDAFLSAAGEHACACHPAR